MSDPAPTPKPLRGLAERQQATQAARAQAQRLAEQTKELARRRAPDLAPLEHAQSQARLIAGLQRQVHTLAPELGPLLHSASTVWWDRQEHARALICLHQKQDEHEAGLPDTLVFATGRSGPTQVTYVRSLEDLGPVPLVRAALKDVADLNLDPDDAPKTRHLEQGGYTRLPGTLNDWVDLGTRPTRLRPGVKPDLIFLTGTVAIGVVLSLASLTLDSILTAHVPLLLTCAGSFGLALVLMTLLDMFVAKNEGWNWVGPGQARRHRRELADRIAALTPADDRTEESPAGPEAPVPPALPDLPARPAVLALPREF